MVMASDSKGGSYSAPPQKVARQTVFRPAPKTFASPSAPPSTTSSGQYSGGHSRGGGAPVAPASNNSQGPINGPGGGGGGGGGNSQAAARRQAIQERRAAQKEKKAERTKAKEYRNYLAGDETYQGQLSTLQKELEDFILSNKSQRGDVREDFTLTSSRIGDERTRALEQMKEDFAARGMLQSSEFADSMGEYDKQYQQRTGDLTRDRDRQLEALLESLGMYRTSNRNERANARAEAIRRRTEAFGTYTPGG